MKKKLPCDSSRRFLEDVSRYCYSQLTLYKYNHSTLNIDDKYREGRITVLNYISELAFYFMKQEKHIVDEFVSEIEKQTDIAASLKTPVYGKGIRDGIEELKAEIKKLKDG